MELKPRRNKLFEARTEPKKCDTWRDVSHPSNSLKYLEGQKISHFCLRKNVIERERERGRGGGGGGERKATFLRLIHRFLFVGTRQD